MTVLRPALALGMAAALLVALQWLSFRNAVEQRAAIGWVGHTHEVIETLQNIPSGLGEAEAALRGFLASGELHVLAPFPSALRRTDKAYKEALALTKDNPNQQKRLMALGRILDERMSALKRDAATGSSSLTAETSRAAIAATSAIRDQVDELIANERTLLAQRSARRDLSVEHTDLMALLGAVAAILLVVTAVVLLRVEDTRRRQAESALRQRVALGQLLQACRDQREAQLMIRAHFEQAFPACAGAVYEIQPSRDSAEAHVRWGREPPGEALATAECWALRRGQPHEVDLSLGALACPHIRASGAAATICQPLTAQGELIGMLHLACRDRSLEEMRAGTQLVVDSLAIAMANLRLNETLRTQSVRDPLTGLYNRRYFEETLDRELAQAQRARTHVAVIILDADHFKQFNDTFGHQGGDLVLRELGGVLRAAVRVGDVAARYGGEEFAMLLAGTNPEHALRRVESICKAVAALEVVHVGTMLGTVTISAGVACFPEQGKTREELIRAADAALYAAKRGGRNRAVLGKRVTVRPSLAVGSNEEA